MKKIILSIFIVFCTISLMACKKKELRSETFTYESALDRINISEVVGDITIKVTTSDTFRIEYQEDEKIYPMSVVVSNTQLDIKRTDNRTAFDRNGFASDPSTVITIPKTFDGTIRIEDTVGNVDISKASTEDLEISVTTGNVELKNVTVSNKLSVSNTAGNTVVEGLDASWAVIETTSGNIEIKDTTVSTILETISSSGSTSLESVSADSMTIKNDNGSASAKNVDPKTNLEIRLTTGSIDVSLSGRKNDYKISSRSNTDSDSTFETSVGDVSVTLVTVVGKISVSYLK